MNVKNFENKEIEIIYGKIEPKFKADGLCDNPEAYKKPMIIIDKDLKQRRQLNVLIEEVFHAYFFELPEWKARKFAANLGKVIYNKHFKKKKE